MAAEREKMQSIAVKKEIGWISSFLAEGVKIITTMVVYAPKWTLKILPKGTNGMYLFPWISLMHIAIF